MVAFSDLTQVMQNARTDAKTLDEYVHGAADTQVTSRLNKRYWTLATLDNKLSLVKIKAEKTLADIDTLAKSATDSITAKSSSANATIDNKAAQANSDIDSKVAAIDTRANSEIANLQSAINAAAAAGAGANGWTASLVESDGLNQQQINDGLPTIAELASIENPRNGQRVYVKSYHTGLNKGGGTFIYDATKSSINDGITINGWVRQVVNKTITTAMLGYKDSTSNAVNIIRKGLAYLKSIGGGTLILDDGLYLLDNTTVIKDPVANQSAYRYWFEPVSNVTITGSKNAILKIADNVIAEDALYKYAKGYQVFNDNNVAENINFKLDGFAFDGNVSNNLVRPLSDNSNSTQSQCHFYNSVKSNGFVASNLYLHHTSGHQIFSFGLNCKNHQVYDCLFAENGNINGNTHLTDHSSIYNEGSNYSFHNNKFINEGFDTVSTAIETHGKNGAVYGNYFKNYNLAILRAAMLSDSNNVAVYGNTGEGLTACFVYEATNGHTIQANDYGNILKLRQQSDAGTRSVVAISTGGQFLVGNTGNHVIRNFNNSYEVVGSSKDTLAILGGKVPYIESNNNEFVNFAAYYRQGTGNSTGTAKVVLKDKIKNLSYGPSLVMIANWDNNIANYTTDLDVDVKELTSTTAIKAVVESEEASAKITGIVKGNFNESIYPYHGAWNVNDLRFDMICKNFTRSDYGMPAKLSGVIKSQNATYQKGVDSGLTSDRKMSSQPSVVQTGGDYQGDVIYNTNVSIGGNIGWVCVDPNLSSVGVWKTFGNIS